MLDVRRLRVLRELAARGTIAATADALGYTAPAVSQQLQALEREAGVELLERNGRRRKLTPVGEELVARTEGILRELEAAEAALERTTTHVAGVLRCAAFASAHRVLLPQAIAALATRHPDLHVTTRDLEPEDSLPALKLGELDLALAQEYAFAPNAKDPALERTDLLEDRVNLALPAGHPRATDEEVAIEALEEEPWIAGKVGSFCHLVVIHSARQAG
jgi:DNA-binding transcriptional LysR family regulator